MSHFRQGDVLLVGVTKDPVGERRRERRVAGRLILLEGEATGHAHAIRSRSADIFAVGEVRYLRATRQVWLRHEEHAPIGIPSGLYEIRRQREYVPEALPRWVTD